MRWNMHRNFTAHRPYFTAHLWTVYTALNLGRWAGQWAWRRAGRWAGRWSRSPPACSCCTLSETNLSRHAGLLCTVLHLPCLLHMRRKNTAHLTVIYCTKLRYGVKGAGRRAGRWAGRWPRSPPACSCCTRHCVTWRRDKAVLTIVK